MGEEREGEGERERERREREIDRWIDRSIHPSIDK